MSGSNTIVTCGCGAKVHMSEAVNWDGTLYRFVCPVCNLQASAYTPGDAVLRFVAARRKYYEGRPNSIERLACKVKLVIWQAPATVVVWEDGSKTVVKCPQQCTYCKEWRGTELCSYSPEHYPVSARKWRREGLINALLKGAYGNKYIDVLERWVGDGDGE